MSWLVWISEYCCCGWRAGKTQHRSLINFNVQWWEISMGSCNFLCTVHMQLPLRGGSGVILWSSRQNTVPECNLKLSVKTPRHHVSSYFGWLNLFIGWSWVVFCWELSNLCSKSVAEPNEAMPTCSNIQGIPCVTVSRSVINIFYVYTEANEWHYF